ncbi:MAG: quinolinate synthase NadA [Planctomycetes bacterium]|nr:quinolinate synthase NadA [Planctomycetota bacterium]
MATAAPDVDEVKRRLRSRKLPFVLDVDIEAKADLIAEVLRLKAKHNVVILGHNYMEPLVFDLSDLEERGDSLQLSMYAARTSASTILFNGVVFMAETAKVLNPDKRVLIADMRAGCSLADNFRGPDVRALKERYPGVPVMIYINSYADAKAECDVCCTSANAPAIASALPGDRVLFVPDILFAQNLETELRGRKEVLFPGKGNDVRGAVCEVHERFTLEDLRMIRGSFEIPKGHASRIVYAHWECRPDVLREADVYGSTSQIRSDIARRVKEGRLEKAFVASECELTTNLMAEFPGVEFATACFVRCQHMARITLDGVLTVLRALDAGTDLKAWEVSLDRATIDRARRPIERMLEMSTAAQNRVG